jgi:cytidylate kinase
VSAHPEVRRELVGRQRAWVAAHGGGVVEGRDIGSVVLPDADLKIYLTASAEVRSRRRADPELARRDALDSGRAASPLVVPDGSIVIDSTDRSVEQVVEEVLSHL